MKSRLELEAIRNMTNDELSTAITNRDIYHTTGDPGSIMSEEEKPSESSSPSNIYPRDELAQITRLAVIQLGKNLKPDEHTALTEVATVVAGLAHSKSGTDFTLRYRTRVFPLLNEYLHLQLFPKEILTIINTTIVENCREALKEIERLEIGAHQAKQE